jgi:cation:H+ antiporter
MILDIVIIAVTSYAIYLIGEKFATASSRLGDYFHLSKSVKGATFDAISSSFPELMIAVFSVVAFKQFEVGVGTIVGSAFFNLLIIPGICVLVAPVIFKVSREIMHRDAIFYNISVLALLSAVIYSSNWSWSVPIIFLLIYFWYLRTIARHTKDHRKINEKAEETKEISLTKEISVALISMGVIALASYFMTDSAISIAEVLNISPVIIAFSVIAAATSIPDAVISIINAKKGNVDDAIANVFGSNTFNILVILSVPVLLLNIFNGEAAVEVVFDQIEILLGLLGATILVIYYLAEDDTISRKEAWMMIALYFVFLFYLAYLSIGSSVVAQLSKLFV